MIAPPSVSLASPETAFREAVLRAHGASDAVLPELLAYTQNAFENAKIPERLPLPDEPFVAAWEEYVREAERVGAWECLRRRLCQLRFPIHEGISQTAAYLDATRRGRFPDGDDGLRLERPDALRLFLHPSPAGRIPVIVPATRSDFIALARAFAHRNEPVPIPDAMGACIVGGFNNWDRVRALRREWEAGRAFTEHADWASAFRAIVPRRELYQDRFMVLSTGPYSAVPAAELGLADAEWAEASLVIRREHECAHYFTRRAFGSMKNALHDEIIADYCGITAAAGRFRADWFLRFMGLESFPAYRPGGRLENYRGKPPLSDAAFRVLQSLVHAAARTLEEWDRQRAAAPRDPAASAAAIVTLAGTSLELLAAGRIDAQPLEFTTLDLAARP